MAPSTSLVRGATARPPIAFGGPSALLVPAATGTAAGVLALVTDLLLAKVMSGQWLPVVVVHAGWYGGVGCVTGLVVAAASRRHLALGVSDLVAASYALLYLVPVVERVWIATLAAGGPGLGIVAGIVAAGSYLAGGETLRRLGPGPAVGWGGLGLGAALGLALNRNVLGRPLEARSLAVDLAVLLGVVLSVRLARRVQPVAILLALACGGAVVAALVDDGPGSRIAREAGPSHPNLLFVVVDTLRADVFTAVVEETAEGAALRRALGPAVWFDEAVAAAPWTVPSVGSLLTGLYPAEHGFDRAPGGDPNRPIRRLPSSVTTLAEHLAGEGYETLAVTTNPFLQAAFGVAQGFGTFVALDDVTAKLPLLTAVRSIRGRPGSYQSADRVAAEFERRVDRLADRAPFFAWLHFMDPHAPLVAHDLPEDPAVGPELGTAELRYRGEVRFVVAAITGVLEGLAARGLDRRTVVVLTSDHGEELPSDRRAGRDKGGNAGRGHGHSLHRELTRIPLVVRPIGGLEADRRVGHLVSHVDLPLTLTELLDLPPMGPRAGRVSAAPWVLEPTVRHREGRLGVLLDGIDRGPPQRGLRTSRYKLVERVEEGPSGESRQWSLFDLEQDPFERRNLAASRPGVRQGLAGRLEEAFAALEAPPPEAEAGVDDETSARIEALGYL